MPLSSWPCSFLAGAAGGVLLSVDARAWETCTSRALRPVLFGIFVPLSLGAIGLNPDAPKLNPES